MDNEKLLKERNEKLALWSGFEGIPSGGIAYPEQLSGGKSFIGHSKFPDFEKVDTCIKWLLPKIEGLAGVTFFPNGKGYWWKVMSNVGVLIYEGDTLAEAIEKYVDWVKENEGNDKRHRESISTL